MKITRRPWTTTELAELARLYPICRTAHLSKLFNRSKNAIRTQMKHLKSGHKRARNLVSPPPKRTIQLAKEDSTDDECF